ncbi:MAG TPA: phasin family protein [Rudaea sp.]|nr:phasin family protein [Rudaea sp.]
MSKPKLKKAKPKAAATPAREPKNKAVAGKSLMESAQHIWLAGLGAFAKAQEEGGKLFEALIKEGAQLEQKTRRIATGTVDDMRGAVETSVTQVRERTQDTWDKLEQVFENRVSRALNKLGVPGRKDLDELLKRVDELNQEVRKLNGNARANLTRVAAATARRARDDLSDLARELEEAQLAAKTAEKRNAKPRKAARPAR